MCNKMFGKIHANSGIVGAITKIEATNKFLQFITSETIARLLASMVAGFVQMVFLFPMEKFVLLKEKKEDAPAEAE